MSRTLGEPTTHPTSRLLNEGWVWAVFFTSIFWAWVRMAWKGLALKSEFAMIIGCRILSSFLTCGIGATLGPGVGKHTVRFSVGFEKGVCFSLPRSTQYLVSSREAWIVHFSRAQRGFLHPESPRWMPQQRSPFGCPTELPQRALPWLFALVVWHAIWNMVDVTPRPLAGDSDTPVVSLRI